MPQEPMEWVQLDQSTQLRNVLECYNVTIEEEDDDLRNINIPKAEGHREVEGPQIDNLDITVLLKTKQINIGTDVELKFSKIGDYWDDTTMDKVSRLLCEYQDLFRTKFSYLKGIIGDLGIMNISLKLDMKPIKKILYLLHRKYKEKVCQVLDKMLEVGIIEPIEESDWVSPMVVQDKKQKVEMRICVDLQKLNDACVHDPSMFLDMKCWKMLEGRRPTHLLMGSLDTIRLRSRLRIGEK